MRSCGPCVAAAMASGLQAGCRRVLGERHAVDAREELALEAPSTVARTIECPRAPEIMRLVLDRWHRKARGGGGLLGREHRKRILRSELHRIAHSPCHRHPTQRIRHARIHGHHETGRSQLGRVDGRQRGHAHRTEGSEEVAHGMEMIQARRPLGHGLLSERSGSPSSGCHASRTRARPYGFVPNP